MKTHFAKYRPVEEEIKQGDLPCQVLDTHSNKIIEYKESEYGSNASDYYKKIKLTLCSRDIQVGDEVISNNGPKFGFSEYKGIATVVENGIVRVIETKGGSEAWGQLPAYKIVGEISTKATWVKEDDEFDEDELLIYCEDKEYPDETFYPRNITEAYGFQKVYVVPRPERFRILVKIKDKDGHFQ